MQIVTFGPIALLGLSLIVLLNESWLSIVLPEYTQAQVMTRGLYNSGFRRSHIHPSAQAGAAEQNNTPEAVKVRLQHLHLIVVCTVNHSRLLYAL